jgi:magnesium-transporting ATPase (P-type)
MITGDKLDTAVEISKSANLISPGMSIVTIDIGDTVDTRELLEEKEASLLRLQSAVEKGNVCAVVTGRSIKYFVDHGSGKSSDSRLISSLLRCESVVICRSTKDQKAQIAQLVQGSVKSSVLVLCIGDGANDVPMIKQADVGVGIAGKEGRQAAQNADYVITKFSHLERLLLFHGRLNYVRTSKMVLYFIFKNLLLTLPFIYHSLFVALTSSPLVISSTMSLAFNTILTSIPVFALGLLERDVSPNDKLVGLRGVSAERLAQSYPKLYYTGRQNRMFALSLIGNMFVLALAMGIWIYVCSLMPLNDMGAVNDEGKILDLWGMSWVYYTSVFTVGTIAVILISDGVTSPMILSVIYSFVVCATFYISDTFDPANQAGDITLVLLSHTWSIWPVIFLAAVPPMMLLIGMKAWIYRFNPTIRMIWQDAKERADIRRKLIRKIHKNKNEATQKRLLSRHRTIMEQPRSFVYHPERLEEGTSLLSHQSMNQP